MSVSALFAVTIVMQSQHNSSWQTAEWSKNGDAHYEKLIQMAIEDVDSAKA